MTPTEFEAARGYPTSTLLVKKLDKHATTPTYGSNAAAGLDLYANFGAMRGDAPEPHGHPLFVEDDYVVLKPGQRKLFKTGIAIACAPSTYARIAPRSGLAYKHGIDVMAGVVDEDYRGDVGVILINHGDEDFVVKHGDRIAQLIITHYLASCPVEVSEVTDTDRGGGGFGSTGK